MIPDIKFYYVISGCLEKQLFCKQSLVIDHLKGLSSLLKDYDLKIN